MSNGDHMHDMGGMASPSPANINTTTWNMHMKKLMTMHMIFFWGTNAEILFSGWPGTNSGMYVLALAIIFAFGVVVEWLSHCELIKPGCSNVAAGLVQTLLHAIRIGLAYMVMLAVMSSNGGVFLAAVAGHAFGFWIFGSEAFKERVIPHYEKHFDLPPI